MYHKIRSSTIENKTYKQYNKGRGYLRDRNTNKKLQLGHALKVDGRVRTP